MADVKIMAKVNPVFRTALGTTMLLAKGGDTLARDYIQAMEQPELDCSPLVTGEEQTAIGEYSFKLLNYVLTLEYRHKMMNQLLLGSGCPNVLDLACGYTPRAVRMSRQGINYVGGDIPIVIQTMNRIIRPYRQESRTLMAYRAVDVTNPEAMCAAADLLAGPVCIATEGLLGYLQDDEARMLCTNIREILQEHGGCWFTMDPYYSCLAAAVAHALDESAEEIEKASLQGGAAVSNTPNMAKLDRDPAAMQELLSACGLEGESVPFYMESLALANERFLPVEKRERFRQEAAKLQAFRITVRDDAPAEAPGREQAKESSTLVVDDGILIIRLVGRLDAISAPEILQAYESIGSGACFREIRVEAEKLTYLSSTGLRVLLLIADGSHMDRIHIRQANDTIREFLIRNDPDRRFLLC
jgi:O-methyltransferase involved in polyketide biosynthesis